MSKQISRIGKRFTIVIPQEIRKKLQLKEGEPITIVNEGNQIIIEAQREDYFQKLEDLLQGIEFNQKTREDAYKFALKLSEKSEGE